MASTVFGSDRVLLYDIDPWNALGFGVPNFGDNIGTLNQAIHRLADEIGRGQLVIMTHIDAQRLTAPSINTVQRLAKVLNRVQSILVGRQKKDNELRVEEGHATANPVVWNIHPVPFFQGTLVRNHWMSEYNRLVMMALTNMYQHADNRLALTITAEFARQIWQYFNEIKLLLGGELLQIPSADLKAEGFIFTDAHFAAYNPTSFTLSQETLDSPGQMFSALTEDDLRPMHNGIPANLIAPYLKQYPIGPMIGSAGLSGEALTPAAAIVGLNTAKAAAGGTVGQPGDTSPSGDAARASTGSGSTQQSEGIPPPSV